jgi:hypothetical protein
MTVTATRDRREGITSVKLKEKASQGESWGFFEAGKITCAYRMPKGYEVGALKLIKGRL